MSTTQHSRRGETQARSPGWLDFAREVAESVLDLAWPTSCASCHAAGRAVCDTCIGNLPLERVRDRLPGDIAMFASARFEEPLQGIITAFKDHSRLDVAWVLRRLLAEAVREAELYLDEGRAEDVHSGFDQRVVQSGPQVWVVPAPSSARARRERGRFPLGELTRPLAPGARRPCGTAQGACAADVSAAGFVARVLASKAPDGRSSATGSPSPTLVYRDVLCHARQVRDQSHLTRAERAANLAGAFTLTPEAVRSLALHAHPIIVVDDVVTTGATVSEAVRTLKRAGAGTVVVAAIARTPRARP